MSATKRFESLDGLRGICALMVVIMHCDTVLHTGHLLNHAYLCVDVFFALSGFVVAHAYEHRLESGLSFGGFVAARARRLLPVHFLGTAIVSIVFLCAGSTAFTTKLSLSSSALAVLLGLLLVPNPFSPTGIIFPSNSILWSLWDEWIVNFAYAKLFYAARTRWILAISIGALLPLALYAYRNPFGLCIGMRDTDFAFGPLRALFQFPLGVVVYRLHAGGRLGLLPNLRPALVYSLVFFCCAIPTVSATPTFDLIVAMLVPLCIALLARSGRPTNAVFRWLGIISYPLYVSQLAVLAPARFLVSGYRLHGIAYAIPIVAACVVLAWLITIATDSRPFAMRFRDPQKSIAPKIASSVGKGGE